MERTDTRVSGYQPIRPVMTQPMVGVILKRCVTVSAFRSLSFQTNEDALFTRGDSDWDRTGTFFWVITTTVSFPRTDIAV